MSDSILITGATGRVGGATLRALQADGADPIVLVRDPIRAGEALGGNVRVRIGDLGDEQSIRAALDGIDRVLLCSGNNPEMREHQLNVVRAIEASDARRVVKISGSPVSIAPDSEARTGRDHLAIEEALRASGREAVAIRPNTFMQNFTEQALAVGHGALPGPDGEPRVSFIDARDIGRVAAASLLAGEQPDDVLEVTGPEALSWFDAAEIMSTALGRPITHYPASPELVEQALSAMGRPQWAIEHTLELAALMREPKAAEVTDTVERITRRAPTTLDQFVAEHAGAFPPAS